MSGDTGGLGGGSDDDTNGLFVWTKEDNNRVRNYIWKRLNIYFRPPPFEPFDENTDIFEQDQHEPVANDEVTAYKTELACFPDWNLYRLDYQATQAETDGTPASEQSDPHPSVGSPTLPSKYYCCALVAKSFDIEEPDPLQVVVLDGTNFYLFESASRLGHLNIPRISQGSLKLENPEQEGLSDEAQALREEQILDYVKFYFFIVAAASPITIVFDSKKFVPNGRHFYRYDNLDTDQSDPQEDRTGRILGSSIDFFTVAQKIIGPDYIKIARVFGEQDTFVFRVTTFAHSEARISRVTIDVHSDGFLEIISRVPIFDNVILDKQLATWTYQRLYLRASAWDPQAVPISAHTMRDLIRCDEGSSQAIEHDEPFNADEGDRLQSYFDKMVKEYPDRNFDQKNKRFFVIGDLNCQSHEIDMGVYEFGFFFTGDVNFEGATFRRRASFANSLFRTVLDFSSAQIDGFLRLSNAEIWAGTHFYPERPRLNLDHVRIGGSLFADTLNILSNGLVGIRHAIVKGNVDLRGLRAGVLAITGLETNGGVSAGCRQLSTRENSQLDLALPFAPTKIAGLEAQFARIKGDFNLGGAQMRYADLRGIRVGGQLDFRPAEKIAEPTCADHFQQCIIDRYLFADHAHIGGGFRLRGVSIGMTNPIKPRVEREPRPGLSFKFTKCAWINLSSWEAGPLNAEPGTHKDYLWTDIRGELNHDALIGDGCEIQGNFQADGVTVHGTCRICECDINGNFFARPEYRRPATIQGDFRINGMHVRNQIILDGLCVLGEMRAIGVSAADFYLRAVMLAIPYGRDPQQGVSEEDFVTPRIGIDFLARGLTVRGRIDLTGIEVGNQETKNSLLDFRHAFAGDNVTFFNPQYLDEIIDFHSTIKKQEEDKDQARDEAKDGAPDALCRVVYHLARSVVWGHARLDNLKIGSHLTLINLYVQGQLSFANATLDGDVECAWLPESSDERVVYLNDVKDCDSRDAKSEDSNSIKKRIEAQRPLEDVILDYPMGVVCGRLVMVDLVCRGDVDLSDLHIIDRNEDLPLGAPISLRQYFYSLPERMKHRFEGSSFKTRTKAQDQTKSPSDYLFPDLCARQVHIEGRLRLYRPSDDNEGVNPVRTKWFYLARPVWSLFYVFLAPARWVVSGFLRLISIMIRFLSGHRNGEGTVIANGNVSDEKNRRYAHIDGALDLSFAQINHLVLSASSFQVWSSKTEEPKPLTMHIMNGVRSMEEKLVQIALNWTGRLRDQKRNWEVDWDGVSLERAKVDFFQYFLDERPEYRNFPTAVRLHGLEVERWDLDPDNFQKLLKRDREYQQTTYQMVRRELMDQGLDRPAKQIFREMRRAQRMRLKWTNPGWIYDRWIEDTFFAYFTKIGSHRLKLVMGLWLLLSIAAFSLPQNVVVAPDRGELLYSARSEMADKDAMPERPNASWATTPADTHPELGSWTRADGFWLALRYHIPMISLFSEDKWLAGDKNEVVHFDLNRVSPLANTNETVRGAIQTLKNWVRPMTDAVGAGIDYLTGDLFHNRLANGSDSPGVNHGQRDPFERQTCAEALSAIEPDGPLVMCVRPSQYASFTAIFHWIFVPLMITIFAVGVVQRRVGVGTSGG
ncbi:MAG: pentapeptide repeat-containing protein [Alphaproteobacteria bacterium]